MPTDLSVNSVPDISVLLPVHNGAAFLEEAVRSVMVQTHRNIEIVVVDDASTDESPAILSRLAGEDPRIRVVRQECNLRLPGALNHGLDLVRGTYVARMDADDVCEPRRLEIQKAFLDRRADVTLVGCSVHRVNGDGTTFQTSVRAQDPFASRWMCRFVMPFRHPTFMFRRAEMALRYDPEQTVSEDYDILARLTTDHHVACLPDVLLRYREHVNSLTGNRWGLMLSQARAIALTVQQADLGSEVFDGLEPFRAAYFDQKRLDRSEIGAMFAGLRTMIAADVRTSPGHRAWIRRQTAQLAAQALLRAGFDKTGIVRGFVMSGRDFLPHLAMRFMETRGSLPRRLRSDPDVWTA